MKKIFNINKKGFTLVELLITIVILILVMSVTIYTAIRLINNSKEKSYEVTINNVIANANNYVTERNLFFVSKDEKTEYQCITVENLIDAGYLNNNIVNTSKTAENETVKKNDYIYIERNSQTKAVAKTEYIKNEGANENCDRAMMAKGDIIFKSSPAFDVWSKSKTITIIYKLNNLNDVRTINDYRYDYQYIIDETIEDEKTDNFAENTATEKLEITTNGKLKANIYTDPITEKEKIIDKIDNEKPMISLVNDDPIKVRQVIIIPIKVTDSASGVNHKSFTKDDLEVKTGENTPTKITFTKESCNKEKTECLYNLKIEDSIHEGSLKITIDEDKVFDNAENGNARIEFNTNMTFSNTYDITYDLTGGSLPISNPETYTSTTPDFTLNNSTKTGYKAVGWTEQIVNLEWYKGFLNYTTGEIENSSEYPNSYYSELISLQEGITYTISGIGDYDTTKIRWRAYDQDGKYLGSMSAKDALTPNRDYYVRLLYYMNPTQTQMSGTVITSKIVALDWKKGFLNYETGAIENITKYPDSYYTNLFPVKSGRTYIISGIGNYNIRRMRWRGYNQAGEYLGSMSATNNLTPDRDYYTRLLYYINPTQAQMSNTIVSTSTTSIPIGSKGNRKYTAIWNPNIVHIRYNMNGGSWAGTTDKYLTTSGDWVIYDTNNNVQDANYDTTINLANYNNKDYINISKSGYVGKIGAEWCTGTNGDGICYNHSTNYENGGTDASHFCDASNGDCTVDLYVNWVPKPIRIYYNPNGGTVGGSYKTYKNWVSEDGTSYFYQVVNSGAEVDLYNYGTFSITKNNYVPKSGAQWCTTSAGGGTCYNQDTKYTYNKYKSATTEKANFYELDLYVNWTPSELKCCATACSGSYNCTQIGGSKAVWKDNKCWLTYTDRTTCPSQWTTDSSKCQYITGGGGGGGTSTGGGGGSGGCDKTKAWIDSNCTLKEYFG